MAKLPIPDFGIEYPDYEYRAWPKYVGMTRDGEALIAKDEKHADELKELAFFPHLMGQDRDGKDVIAQIPRDLEWLASKVVNKVQSAVNALTDEQPRRGPGRPPKVEAA